MLYYVNWVLTNAQLELIAADVSVVDYSYDRKQKKKGRKGEFNDAKASKADVKKARDAWMEKYGKKEEAKPAGGISIGSVFGGSLTPTEGFR